MKEVTIEYLIRFKDLFKNLPSIILSLEKQIGLSKKQRSSNEDVFQYFENYKMSSELGQSIVRGSVLAPGQGPYDLSSPSRRIKYTLEGNVFIDPRISVAGLNAHKNHPTLFISGAPEVIVGPSAKKLLPNAQNLAPINTMSLDQPQIDPMFILARDHAEKMIRRIETLSRKPVTCLILGSQKDAENTCVYSQLATQKHQTKQNSKITKSTTKDLSATTTTVYSLNASAHCFPEITSATISELYQIYTETLGHKNEMKEPDPLPLLIQCSDGLGRAPKIAYAYDVFINFDEYFKSNDLSETIRTLKCAFSELRQSRSPVALSHTKDLEQALYLAFALKMISIEIQCAQQILDFTKKYGDSPDFSALKQGIITTLCALQKLDSYQERFADISMRLAQQPQLTTHHQMAFLAPVRGMPNHYSLLNTLRNAFDIGRTVEKATLKILLNTDTYQLVNDEENDDDDDDETLTLST